MEKILNNEDPDLVVFTGDVVDPACAAKDFSYHFTSALELIKNRKIPYMWTGGSNIDGLSRMKMHEIDYGYGMSLSYTGHLWDLHMETHKAPEQEKLGYFTARVPIMDPNIQTEIMSIYTFDTSFDWCLKDGLPGESCISTEAVDWFNDQQYLYSHGHRYRDFIFLHKPIPEFMHLANRYEISGHKQQEINCSALNSGLFATAMDKKKTVWVNVGNDAYNDFSGRYHEEMMFSYARKSGFSGPGNLKRGARAFRLSLDNENVLHGISYVVEEPSGKPSEMMQRQNAPTFGFSLQTECGVDPFEQAFGLIYGDFSFEPEEAKPSAKMTQ